jgi:Tfp pilus assembly protein PilF
MRNWKITGIIATIIIILSIPLYLLKMGIGDFPPTGPDSILESDFAGSRECMECHQKEFEAWSDSHHDRAMDEAGDSTVLGDFNDATFEIFGVGSRFYRKNGKFFVHTQGPGGEMGDFEVTHTFGWYPLQQYLVPFPGGRLQCLPIAWDDRKKQWYHLYPDEPLDPQDWLYWTNAGQNWNGMCAECHSTNLKKNYDIDSDSYQTTWSDIDVGCEACHGPGSRHIDWAEMPDMARPQVKNYELAVETSNLGSRDLVELCAPCHSRRAILGDYTHAEPDLLDIMLPSLLTEELYFADGQILDEVYVYGSFTQSKMYHRDVRCNDCHDVHSVKTIREGNELCLQCHRAEEYDVKAHHFHKEKGDRGDPVRARDGSVLFEVGTGADCVQCHMPGRDYMGIDYRPDHSFRIPRPDLSISMGVPNACNRCHIDKSAGWSDEYITQWYGPGRKSHFGEILEAGRKLQPDARENLIRLAADPLYPVNVRATAIHLLQNFPSGEDIDQLYSAALMDDEAMIRRSVLEFLPLSNPDRIIDYFGSMLYDPVKAVRIQAAAVLAGEPARQLESAEFKVYEQVLEEYVAAMEYSGDFTFGRFNLGNLYTALNQPERAIDNYRAAIKIDELSYPAKVNLAMLYDRLDQKDKAERLLRQVVTAHPEIYEVSYSLGLLLAELQKYDEAIIYLEKAAANLTARPRVYYNYGQLLQYLNRGAEAEKELLRAYELAPENPDFMFALADFYYKNGRLSEARRFAQKMVDKYPEWEVGHQLLNLIDQ